MTIRLLIVLIFISVPAFVSETFGATRYTCKDRSKEAEIFSAKIQILEFGDGRIQITGKTGVKRKGISSSHRLLKPRPWYKKDVTFKKLELSAQPTPEGESFQSVNLQSEVPNYKQNKDYTFDVDQRRVTWVLLRSPHNHSGLSEFDPTLFVFENYFLQDLGADGIMFYQLHCRMQ